MRLVEFLVGLALFPLGLVLLLGRVDAKLLDAERRYGPKWQQEQADTPQGRRRVRVISAVTGTFFLLGALRFMLAGLGVL